MMSTTNTHAPSPEVSQWLLDGDPAVRWQVMRDLIDAPPEAVANERARVATEGWGAQCLAQQRADGNWGDGQVTPHWRSNLYTLLLLRHLGVDPASASVRAAIARTREQVTWGPEFGNAPFFAGEVEPCINGGTTAFCEARAPPRDSFADDLEDGAGQSSRWITLRALRVLAWYS